jgi:uncharacterized protein
MNNTQQPITHLLYLHGFRSSPQSTKAQAMGRVVQRLQPPVQWWCPQLPPSPAAAMQLLEDGVAPWGLAAGAGRLAIMGSSLGGFYAAVLARRLGCRAVLINPAAHPARDLARHIGAHTHWHDPSQAFFFEAHFISELEALGSGLITAPAQALALIATGDEVLDWREMAAFCAPAQINLIEGSDHALSDFDHHLPGILEFLHLV